MKISTYVLGSLLLIMTALMSGCGGDNDKVTTPVDQQGTFIDSLVSGLRYESTSNSGFTNTKGEFTYREGEVIRFYVGDVLIGESLGKGIITPVDLVSGAIDETNIQVQNIAIFLQSIDEDGDESNGINITLLTNSAAIGKTADFTLASGVFEVNGAIEVLISNLTSVNGTARSILPRTQVTNTFQLNLLSLFSGTYKGTFSGDDSGSWEVTIDNRGVIAGQSISKAFGTEQVTGAVSSSGQTSISGQTTSGVFTGVITRNGKISGTWLDADGAGGSFSGSKISISNPPVIGDKDVNSGRVSISGNDAAMIGASFIPNLKPSVLNDPNGPVPNLVIVGWSQSIVVNNQFEARSLQLTYDISTGKALVGGYIRLTSVNIKNPPTSYYSYSFNCVDAPLICQSISINIPAKQVTFDNFTLIADGDDDATANVTFNGALSW